MFTRLTSILLAAFAALAVPSAHAIRTPLHHTPDVLSEPHVAAPSEVWIIEAVYPLGQTHDGDRALSRDDDEAGVAKMRDRVI